MTASMFAAKKGDKEIVELLLNRGADVHAKDDVSYLFSKILLYSVIFFV